LNRGVVEFIKRRYLSIGVFFHVSYFPLKDYLPKLLPKTSIIPDEDYSESSSEDEREMIDYSDIYSEHPHHQHE